MYFQKLIFCNFLVVSSVSWAEPDTGCFIPSSRSAHFTARVPAAPALPIEATQAVQIATTVATTGGVMSALGVSQVAQGARSQTLLQLASCNDAAEHEITAPAWSDSPTQMSVGSDELRYALGTVIGNSVVCIGSTLIWGTVAYRLGTAEARFPGGLALPVFFVLTSTITAAVDLVRQGVIGQRLVGGCMPTTPSVVEVPPPFVTEQDRWDAL